MENNLKFENTYIQQLVKLAKFRINNRTQNQNVPTFGFIIKVYDLYRRVLGLKEYQFSEQVLNGSRDYYAMIKNTKTKVGEDKLRSVLVNTRALVEHLTDKDTESELVKLYRQEADLYIRAIEMFFAAAEKQRLNLSLVKKMKISDLVVMV